MAYNDKIIIQSRTNARDDYGELDPTWATYKTVWAERDDTAGNLSYEADMPVYAAGMIFRIHTHDAPAVTTKHRVSWNSQLWKIRSVQKEGRLNTILVTEAYDDE